MDTLDTYRYIVQQVLAAYADIPYAYGDVHTEVVCDRNADRYLLMTVGWDRDSWIQRDGTEQGIATEPVAAGIPKSSIVLAFHRPEIRCHTEYAVA
jgi:hypothetical protein